VPHFVESDSINFDFEADKEEVQLLRAAPTEPTSQVQQQQKTGEAIKKPKLVPEDLHSSHKKINRS
jgi:hypothetical protein